MIAVVYDVKSPIAAKAADELEGKGWKVIRKSYGEVGGAMETECESADLLVIHADVSGAPADENVDVVGKFATDRIYDIHKLIQCYVPLLYKGDLKRIALISERESSVRLCREKTDYARHMLLAGINMKFKMLFNKYRQEGFTIRCFALSSEEAKEGSWGVGEGISPVEYILLDFSNTPEDVPMHSEENNFVMRNKWFEEVEW